MQVIFLILSGADNKICVDNLDIYKELTKLSCLYYEKMKQKYDFKYFFYEYNNDITEDIIEQDNFLYIKGIEEFHKIYEKTIKAIDYINKKYNYDYLIRTNISSFWNIDNMFTLSNQLPKMGCLSGFYIFDSFISGTGIIMSKDVCNILIREQIEYNKPDDIMISENLKKHFKISPLQNDKIYFLINNEINIPDNTDDILYFRIKNNDRTIDIQLFKLLLKRIYDITPFAQLHIEDAQ